MAPLNTATVLSRKLAPGTAPPATTVMPTAAQALARAWSRCVSDALPLVVQGMRPQSSVLSLAEALDMIDGDGFAALLGDGGPGFGLFVMDQQGFSALVEAMTIGRLSPRAVGQRRPTGTDAALLATLIDACLSLLPAPAPPSPPDLLALLGAHRFNRQIADHRLLSILLEDGSYDRLTLEGFFVSGTVERAFAATVLIPRRPVIAPETAAGEPARDDPWARHLEQSVMAAPALLCAELGRVPMTLARLGTLKPGDCLTLPLSALEEIALRDLQGRAIGVGRLGQSRGMRAIRLTSNLNPAETLEPVGPLALPDWQGGDRRDAD